MNAALQLIYLKDCLQLNGFAGFDCFPGAFWWIDTFYSRDHSPELGLEKLC